MKGEIAGRLRLGVIPTVAPYLLHKFLPGFVHDYPHVELEVKELMTRDIVDAMKHDRIDARAGGRRHRGDGIQEQELFDDRFFIYVSPDNPLLRTFRRSLEDIDLRDLILLSDGNCMRDQVIDCVRPSGACRRTTISSRVRSIRSCVSSTARSA